MGGTREGIVGGVSDGQEMTDVPASRAACPLRAKIFAVAPHPARASAYALRATADHEQRLTRRSFSEGGKARATFPVNDRKRGRIATNPVGRSGGIFRGAGA
jgi:hypothetical protein